MKSDIKTNFDIAEALAYGTVTDGTANSSSINAASGASGAFVVEAGAVGTTLDAELQFSDDDSTFVAATDERNDIDMTQLDAVGMEQMDVVVWEKQYARIQLTAVGACSFAVVSILGPKYSV